MVPLPSFNVPSQTALAFRTGILNYLLYDGLRFLRFKGTAFIRAIYPGGETVRPIIGQLKDVGKDKSDVPVRVPV
jgi:hypothetical protein